MRLKQWAMMVMVVALCMAAGAYFGRAIGSKQDPEPPSGSQATLPEPTASSPPVSLTEAQKAGPQKVVEGLNGRMPRTAASAAAGPGPFIEWDIGQTAGDMVPDITGHGYDARIRGHSTASPTWGGRPALEFDGQGDNDFWHDHPPNCGLSIEKRLGRAFTELSIEAWVCNNPSGWMPIIYRDKWDEASGFGLYMEWSAGKAVFGHYYDASHKSSVQSERVVQDGHWHHLVGTIEPIAGEGYRYRMYVDGSLDAEQTGSWAVTEAPPEGGILMIGYPNSTGADRPFHGALGGIAVFDVALTPAQVKARFEAQRPAALGEIADQAPVWAAKTYVPVSGSAVSSRGPKD